MEGILIPQQIFVGDTGEFLFPINHLNSNNKVYNNFIIDTPIETNSITIKKICIKHQDKKDYISILFIPWETGIINFPDLPELNKIGITEKLPEIFISSILEAAQVEILQPPRPPIIIPGTSYLLYSISFIVLTILSVLSFTVSLFFRRFKNSNPVHIRKKRYSSFLKKIKFLQKQYAHFYKKEQRKNKKYVNTNNGILTEADNYCNFYKSWLKEFENTMKKYCFDAANHPEIKNDGSSALTYTEILFYISKRIRNIPETYEMLKNIFSHLEYLRFSHIKISYFQIDYEFLTNTALSVIKQIETEIQKGEANDNI